jgi:AhpD family alkylhydroperoxidase
MARLLPVNPEQAAGRARELLHPVQTALGTIPHMMRTVAQSPAVLEGYLGFGQALGNGLLPPKLRQQLALTVAEASRCVYCLSAHTAIGRGVGLHAEELLAARGGTSTNDRGDAALRFARRLVEQRGEVEEAELLRLMAAGYTEGEIAEIIAHVALNIYTNYFNKAADTTTQRGIMATPFPALLRSRGRPSPLQGRQQPLGPPHGPYREGRAAAPPRTLPRTVRSGRDCRPFYAPHSNVDFPRVARPTEALTGVQ